MTGPVVNDVDQSLHGSTSALGYAAGIVLMQVRF
jgi:hypothetical protein